MTWPEMLVIVLLVGAFCVGGALGAALQHRAFFKPGGSAERMYQAGRTAGKRAVLEEGP